MREIICSKHKCKLVHGKCMELEIDSKTGEKKECTAKSTVETSIFWCEQCNVPSYEKICPACNKEGKYLSTDIRPVFPEEKILLAILLGKKDALCYERSSVWASKSHYFVDGKQIKLKIKELNQLPLDEIKEIKSKYDQYYGDIDYDLFNEIINKFVEANNNRYKEITDEAVSYIQNYKERYILDDMFISFSGGKDSTVVADLVSRAFSTNEIIHVFGDTTLEFPSTYEYKKRYAKNHMVLTAKNREKDFEELCEQIGPPSRVMRWCCTVFKTGAITKKLTQAFGDKTNVLVFQGIRHSESSSRSKYDRESESPKITKQTVVSPIIEWIDYDVWLYILATGIDFNSAYRLGYTRVGCWCCPNNGSWSEFLSKVHMFEQYEKWHNLLIDFAKKIGKPDPENYIDGGFWKARQGGNGLEISNTSIISYEPCATSDNAFNFELQKPITEDFYELFKPFGYINRQLGNQRLGEVYILDKKGNIVLVLQGRIGSEKLKVTIKKANLAKARNMSVANDRIQCQITKHQMCIGCKACESICKHNAISIREMDDGTISYKIDDDKCVRCTECVAHYSMGCYIRKVLTIRRDN